MSNKKANARAVRAGRTQDGHTGSGRDGHAGAQSQAPARDVSEPDWGNPAKSQVRRDTTRAERIAGLVWLTIGAIFCLFICVLYIGTRIGVGGTSIPFPWPIVFAALFNAALTKTALLWTPNQVIAAIPVTVWFLGFILIAALPTLPLGGDTLLPSTLWTILLLTAGLAGGAWPLRPRFPVDSPTVTK